MHQIPVVQLRSYMRDHSNILVQAQVRLHAGLHGHKVRPRQDVQHFPGSRPVASNLGKIVAHPPQHSGAVSAMPAGSIGSLGQTGGPIPTPWTHLQQEWEYVTWPGSSANFSVGEGMLEHWHF